MKILEVVDEEHYVHIVTEYNTGGELLDALIDHGQLSERTAVHYFKQVLGAVAYYHAYGKIHGDIRPENVVLPSADDFD